MANTTRDQVIIQLDRIDTALEAPEADKGAILREATDWLSSQSAIEPDDALYYRERLQVIRDRHAG